MCSRRTTACSPTFAIVATRSRPSIRHQPPWCPARTRSTSGSRSTPGRASISVQITVSGLDRVNDSFVRRRLLLHSGEQYSPAAIETAREDLASRVCSRRCASSTPDRLAPDGTLPVDVAVVERPRHVVNFSASYSTDLGVVSARRGPTGTCSATPSADSERDRHRTRRFGGEAAGLHIGPTLAIPDWLCATRR